MLCTVGCVLHLSLSLDYFKYPIILETTRQLDVQTSYTLTLCLDAYYYFTRKSNTKRVLMKPLDFQMFTSNLLNFTIDEMLQNTPDESKLIVLCKMWGLYGNNRRVNDLSVASDRLMLMEANGSTCHGYFESKKFLLQTKICYSFKPVFKLNWNRHQLTNVFSNNFVKIFYMVSFNSSFITPRFSVIVTPENAFHGHSSVWSPHVYENYQGST